MKTIPLVTIFMIVLTLSVSAQSEYNYTYDANGNRIQRSHTSLMIAPPNGNEVEETPKIGEDWAHFSLSLFPNPTREGVNIEVEGEETPEEVVVLDNLGREILRQKFTHSLKPSTSRVLPQARITSGFSTKGR